MLFRSHALATTAGSVLQRWRQEWAHEQPRLLRRQLTEDLSAWGRRHVFGNVRLQDPADPLPYLPLEDIYVAPPASWSAAGSRDEPEHHDNALKLVSRLVAEHHIVVVKAHFGSGKSLTARMLARDLARTWLEDNSSTQRSRQQSSSSVLETSVTQHTVTPRLFGTHYGLIAKRLLGKDSLFAVRDSLPLP